MDISPAILSVIIAILSVPMVLALMRRIRSLRHEPNAGKSFAELSREYGRWEILSIPLSLTLVLILALPIWLTLRLIYRQQLASLEPAQFLLFLPDILWVTPALFFALFLSALPFQVVYRALLGRRRYGEYTEYLNQKFRLDTWKLFRYLGNLMLPICLLLTILALDCYVRITGDSIVVNNFLGFGEKSHALSAVRKVELVNFSAAATGDRVGREHYVIEFADGGGYSFANFPGETSLDRQRLIAVHVARSAGVKITLGGLRQ